MKKSSMPCLHVAEDGSVTIPATIASAFGLRPGMELDVHVTRGGIWLRPGGFDPDQWWHWTPEWQDGEDEIERDRAAGRTGTVYHTLEDFIASLEEEPAGT